jgi:hypothetical protein
MITRSYVVVALLAFAVSASEARACSLIGGHAVRRPDATHLIALPTDRTLSAARALPPDLAEVGHIAPISQHIREPGRWWWWKERIAHWWKRARNAFRPPLPYGQVVRLERVGGAHASRIRAALAASRNEAVLVRWELGADCGPARSERREPWLDRGSRVFTTARLRAKAGWVGGRPTFDVTSFDYPYTEQAPWTDPRGHRVAGPRLAEYWELYETLPTFPQMERDTAAALAPMRAWVRAHPALAAHPAVQGSVVKAEGLAGLAARERRRR